MTDTVVVYIDTNTANVETEKYNTVRLDTENPVTIQTTKNEVVVVDSTSTVLQEVESTTYVLAGAQGPRGPQGLPGINEDDMAYSKRIDFVSETELYKGEAAVGSSEASAVWRIRKITIAGDNDITEVWAAGNANFDKVWANRSSLIYS